MAEVVVVLGCDGAVRDGAANMAGGVLRGVVVVSAGEEAEEGLRW